MKFPLEFLVLFLSTLTPALAQDAEPDPTSMTGEQMLTQCEQKWSNRITAVAQCVTNLRLVQAEATDVTIVARLEKGEERDRDILAAVNELGHKVERFVVSRPSVTQSPPQQAQTTASTSSGVSYARTGGAAWAPVAQPTVVSIHSLNGMVPDTLHIEGLSGSSLRQTCGGVGAPLVVFLDHGVPVANVFAPLGAPTGFVEVYWDRNNDGTPDGTVWALDLQSQDDVWITWGLQNDLEVRYLRPAGEQIAVAGLPLQWVYHPTTRRENPGSGAVGCEKSHLEPRGGHRVTRSMARVW